MQAGAKKQARKNYGKLLRRIRLKRGVSVRHLAKRLGVDHSYISKVEHNKTAPPWSRMVDIAYVLESPELRDIGEHVAIRRFLKSTEIMIVEFKGLSPSLQEEIGTRQIEQLTNLCSALRPKLVAALHHRPAPDWDIGKPALWSPVPAERGTAEPEPQVGKKRS